MTSNTIITMPEIRFIANLSKIGEKKVVIYIPVKYHKEILKAFRDKPMIVTCKEALPEEENKI
jgi:hypothetical protein